MSLAEEVDQEAQTLGFESLESRGLTLEQRHPQIPSETPTPTLSPHQAPRSAHPNTGLVAQCGKPLVDPPRNIHPHQSDES